MALCPRCGKTVPELLACCGNQNLCRECMAQEAEAGNRCPCCGAKVGAEEGVGLLLARPDATPREKAYAPLALAIVCPHCHVLFFDGAQYTLLRSLMLPGE